MHSTTFASCSGRPRAAIPLILPCQCILPLPPRAAGGDRGYHGEAASCRCCSTSSPPDCPVAIFSILGSPSPGQPAPTRPLAKIIDHVTTRRRRCRRLGLRAHGCARTGSRPRASRRCSRRSHTVAAQGGIAASSQHRRITDPHTRHRQGLRLVGDQTRSNIWCVRRRPRLRTRTVQPDRGGHDLPTPVRRHDAEYG